MGAVIDLDVIKADIEPLKLDDKQFDLSEVPFIYTAEFYQMKDDILGLIDSDQGINPEAYRRVMELFAKILQVSDESVTVEWLIKKITLQRLRPFLDQMLSALIGSKKNEEPGADSAAQSNSSSAES